LDGVPPEQMDTLLLLASEVVTNAVQHGAGEVGVAVSARPAAVRVEVSDPGGALPHHGTAAPVDAERGRGLHLLDVLTASWGVTPAPTGGKTVWFEIAAAPTATESTSSQG
jgi:serine/threonine-protein kinase RsbW